MTISNLFKNSGYAAVFGFMGLIVGIWTADLLNKIILHNAGRPIALIIIVLIIVASSVLGFTKGKELLED